DAPAEYGRQVWKFPATRRVDDPLLGRFNAACGDIESWADSCAYSRSSEPAARTVRARDHRASVEIRERPHRAVEAVARRPRRERRRSAGKPAEVVVASHRAAAAVAARLREMAAHRARATEAPRTAAPPPYPTPALLRPEMRGSRRPRDITWCGTTNST